MTWPDGVSRRVSAVSDALHVHVFDSEEHPGLAPNDISEHFGDGSAEVFGTTSAIGKALRSKLALFRVQGWAASCASFLGGQTTVARFRDNILATSFQSGGGIDFGIAETVVATGLAIEVALKTDLRDMIKHANTTLDEFGNFLNFSGTLGFCEERSLPSDVNRILVETIHGELMRRWQQGGPQSQYDAIARKLSLVLQPPSLIEQFARRGIEFPGDGTLAIPTSSSQGEVLTWVA